ncbi:MAG TPA: hypothetical protein VK841_04165 [Polyangiaceae bacterium]|nr:hypothetical protein [Polyangiaceae bacterium]
MPPYATTLASACLAAILVPLAPSAALAASPASQAAARDAQGRKMMAAHDYTAACAKFEESQSISPSVAASLDLGACYEKSGKLASAWNAYKSAAAAAAAGHQKAHAQAARKAMSRVESKMSRITINVADSARASGLEVRMDGNAVDASDWGNALPKDGGSHDVEATAPGKKAWKKHVDLDANGQTVTVDVPSLEDDAPPKKVAVAGGAKGSNGEGAADGSNPAPEGATAADKDPHPGQSQRTIGIAVGIAGIAGIATGIVAGIVASSDANSLKAACGSGPTCDSSNQGTHDSAVTWATVSDVTFIVGGAALATGAVIYLTAPRDTGAVSSVGIAPAARGTGLSLVGRF